ncbi:MAG: hypothetical protein ACFE0J_22025 [Elainellaceae cyanobacterium]
MSRKSWAIASLITEAIRFALVHFDKILCFLVDDRVLPLYCNRRSLLHNLLEGASSLSVAIQYRVAHTPFPLELRSPVTLSDYSLLHQITKSL